MELRKGDVVQFKKPHPCGENHWELLRVGMDFRLKCKGCGHLVMMPRKEAEKKIVKVLKKDSE